MDYNLNARNAHNYPKIDMNLAIDSFMTYDVTFIH